ncbi:MAG: conjugal transfer protein TraN [Qipengyuania citrea]|nr:conjugal transfer protein TraN [Qipengyuania citrea]
MTGRTLANLLAVFVALTSAASIHAQTRDEARADGKDFATELRGEARDAATTNPDAARVPNFDPQATRDLQDLARDPDQIEARARSVATTSTPMRTIRDSMANRARFEPNEIEDVIARSRAINETPLDYTSGMAISGSQGSCVPLPPGSGTAGTYTATCNTGTRIDQSLGQCTVPLVATVNQQPQYHYLCNRFGDFNGSGEPECAGFDGYSCRVTGRRDTCLQWSSSGGRPWCSEPGDPITELTCDDQVPGQTPYMVTAATTVTTTPDESQCTGLADNSDCTLDADICTDADPQTRVIDGVSVTRPCWEWQRSYTCIAREAATDCSDIESQGTCRFVREECLTDEAPCETWERIYECPLPGTDNSTQYVCDGDVYCIDGSCETIERAANDEFKDAVTALHAMDEARGQFDPETLTLFRGMRNTCSSKVFGVLNCCKGKGFPLIPGISLLVALGCSREEVLLHERDAQGLCAYVGTYCSDKFLGVCLTKKKVYCCFESKLSRILQEQGRRQLPKSWDKPKEEQCEGFTLDEFARLDLSQMDFSEVYAEFTEAARLPDELETSILIQQKIEDYYARSGQ